MAEYVKFPGKNNKFIDGFSFLGLGKFTSLITDINFAKWGSTVLIDYIYNVTERLSYRIVFSECDKIEWLLTDSDWIDDFESDIIDFQIIENEERPYAYFHTDIFDLSIYYMNIKIEKDW